MKQKKDKLNRKKEKWKISFFKKKKRKKKKILFVVEKKFVLPV